MGSRRGSTEFTAVRALPWPLGLAMGVGAFFAIRNGVPWLPSCQSGAIAQGFNQGISAVLAPIATMVLVMCCLAALASFFGSYQRRKLLDIRNTLKSLSAKDWSRLELLVGEVTRPQGYAVEETGLASADNSGDLVQYEDGRCMLVHCNSINSHFVPIPPRVATLCLSVLIIINDFVKIKNRVVLAFNKLRIYAVLKFLSCPELLLRSYGV